MKTIEEKLKEKHEVYEKITAPDELEERLRNALDQKKPNHKKRTPWRRYTLVASLILVIFVGYHFDTFAYYGKRLVGYDTVMSDSLKELNELGRGQEIGKSYEFENGVTLTLDGIMVDDNQMIAFYQLKDPNGQLDQYHTQETFKGFFKNYWMGSGQGYSENWEQEMISMGSFDSPRFFERRLTFELVLQGENFYEKATIPFTLNRNEAMGHMIKQKIGQEMNIEGTEITLDHITATATQTVIEGKIGSLVDLIGERVSGEMTRFPSMVMALKADHDSVPSQGSGMRTDHRGTTFEMRFDPLPEEMETLTVEISELMVSRRGIEAIELNQDAMPLVVSIEEQPIIFESLEQKNGEIHLVFNSEETTQLYDVTLMVDGEKAPFLRTEALEYEKTVEGKIQYRRKAIFQGEGNEMVLHIGQLNFSKRVEGAKIDIPLK
ncbi:conserved hypothetical protein [Alkaliphilus metalliredigens QYMF]|uniref:DUF4179 domain-containing protein n=1 Tax=Alkaliphilus metalliredigens (strain QYMF) TaxID=293826 RepID=A6TVV9_ALKMQ|nr:DUF4179 domain-containing protein [Alkaliphilus metalliredigens]ABR50327.1 conserved hypothetical protein [Alkaliphilus metalliredigens QYMF]